MTRYPFRNAVNTFLDEYKHVFAKSTWVERQRALKRMTVVIEQLWEEGKISSTDPSEFTPIDIKEYFVFIKKKELSPKSIEHELGYINSLCEFFGNNCVKTARKRFPNLKTYKRRRRLPTMKYDLIFRIIDEGMKKDDYDSIRDYAVVILALCAGLRPVEMQHVPRDYIDLDEGEIYIDVMKGHGSYGEPRTVPIHPKGIPFLRKYLEIRDRSVEGSDYLFASRTHGRTISTNTLRKDKTNVENEIDCKITFQLCRRTYGQWLIDDGVPSETVSLHLGHTTSRTTETFYARQRESDALEITKHIWEKKGRDKEVDISYESD